MDRYPMIAPPNARAIVPTSTVIPSVATVLFAALCPELDGPEVPPAVEVGVLELAAVETALGSVAKILTLAISK
jgi:hypothetical protein